MSDDRATAGDDARRVASTRVRPLSEQRDVLAVIALGGVLGVLARHGLGQLVPGPQPWPWATFAENLSGSLLLGVLLVVVVEHGRGHRLTRPFLGVGVLGGYTTMSTYGLETHQLVLAGRPGLAAGYAMATLLGALAAVLAGTVTARRLLSGRVGRR